MIHHPSGAFPTLKTERLTLRPLLPGDAPGVFALRSDCDINQYLDRTAANTLDDAIHFIQRITDAINHNEALYWAVVLTEGDTFAGTICLFGFSDQLEKCEIGFELLPGFQGKGMMTEAAARVVEYATQTLNVAVIEAFAHKENQKSIQLLQRLGFQPSTALPNDAPDENDAAQILSLYIFAPLHQRAT